MDAGQIQRLPKPERDALLGWLRDEGLDAEGYIWAVEPVSDDRVAVTFYVDADGKPTRDVDAMVVAPSGTHVEQATVERAVSSIPEVLRAA